MSTRPSELLARSAEMLLALHDLRQAGAAESAVGDALRLDSARLDDDLTADEQGWIDGVAADLYMLSSEELYARVPEEETTEAWLRPRLKAAHAQQDHWAALALLRHGTSWLSPAEVAFLRARSYEALGLADLARRFDEFAVEQTLGQPVADTELERAA